MGNKKSTTKISKKAEINISLKSNSKRKVSTKKVDKQIKKLGFGTIFIVIIILAVCLIGGYFGGKFFLRNDCFVLNGKDEITLQIGESYVDEGVKVILFGKNDESKVNIETNLKKNEDGSYFSDVEGTFYIVYSVDNLIYGKLFNIKKIRLITFVEPTEPDEIVGGGN